MSNELEVKLTIKLSAPISEEEEGHIVDSLMLGITMLTENNGITSVDSEASAEIIEIESPNLSLEYNVATCEVQSI